MNKLELRAKTKQLIRESGCQGVFFADEDVDTANNDGYMELSDETEWFEEYLDIDLLKNRPYYDLFNIIGPFFLSLKPAFERQSNRWLFPSTVPALDDGDRRWERSINLPQRFFMRGLRWLGLWPKTNADGDGTYPTKLYYTRLPEPICDDTDEPGFPDTFHLGICYYAAATLLASDGESKLAVLMWAKYQESEQDLNAWVQKRVQRPNAPVMGHARAPR
jgi:hypothetical protein